MAQPYDATLYLGKSRIGQIREGTMGAPDMATGEVTVTYWGTFAPYWVRALQQASAGATTDAGTAPPASIPPARICPALPGAPERLGVLHELTVDRAVVVIQLRRGTD